MILYIFGHDDLENVVSFFKLLSFPHFLECIQTLYLIECNSEKFFCAELERDLWRQRCPQCGGVSV